MAPPGHFHLIKKIRFEETVTNLFYFYSDKTPESRAYRPLPNKTILTVRMMIIKSMKIEKFFV